MGLLDRSSFVLTAELGVAEGFINTSFYRHLAARKRHRQSAIFIGGISSPEEIILLCFRVIVMGGHYHHNAKTGVGGREIFFIDLSHYLFPSWAGWGLAQTSCLVRSCIALSWVMACRT